MKISSKPKDLDGGGILHPHLTNRFRVLFGNGCRCITMQITRCEVDMVSQTITIICEQSTNNAAEMLSEIKNLSQGSHRINVQLLDEDAEVNGSVDVYGQMIKHAFILDYAKQEAAFHLITFRYK